MNRARTPDEWRYEIPTDTPAAKFDRLDETKVVKAFDDGNVAGAVSMGVGEEPGGIATGLCGAAWHINEALAPDAFVVPTMRIYADGMFWGVPTYNVGDPPCSKCGQLVPVKYPEGEVRVKHDPGDPLNTLNYRGMRMMAAYRAELRGGTDARG